MLDHARSHALTAWPYRTAGRGMFARFLAESNPSSLADFCDFVGYGEHQFTYSAAESNESKVVFHHKKKPAGAAKKPAQKQGGRTASKRQRKR